MAAPFAPGHRGAAHSMMGPLPAYGPYAWLIPEELWYRPKRFWIHTAPFVTPSQLPANGQATFNIGTNRDSVFVCTSITAQVTNVDNVTFIDQPSILVRIRDTASGFDLMDTDVPFINLFNRGGAGDGRKVFLDLPRIFDPGTNIGVTLTNLEATDRHVRISFIGFRVWV